MKKAISIVLSMVMLVCLSAGCGGNDAGSNEGYVVLEDTLKAEEYGIGFRNDDIALGMAVYGALDEMIADGTAADISKDWFGKDILIKDAPLKESAQIAADDDSLVKIINKGTLVIGLDASFPPMGFTDENNNIVGFDIDLAKEVCSRLGVEAVFQPIDWNAKEMELNNGNIDCIWNGMTITDGRVADMFIPKAYVANAQVIIVPEGSDIATSADLADKTVGLQRGSSAMEALESSEVYDSVGEVVQYDDNVACFLDLKTGRIDAMVVDEVVGRYLIETD